MKQKKFIALLAVLIVASMVLAACAPAATPTEAPPAETEEAVDPKSSEVIRGSCHGSLNFQQWFQKLRLPVFVAAQAPLRFGNGDFTPGDFHGDFKKVRPQGIPLDFLWFATSHQIDGLDGQMIQRPPSLRSFQLLIVMPLQGLDQFHGFETPGPFHG